MCFKYNHKIISSCCRRGGKVVATTKVAQVVVIDTTLGGVTSVNYSTCNIHQVIRWTQIIGFVTIDSFISLLHTLFLCLATRTNRTVFAVADLLKIVKLTATYIEKLKHKTQALKQHCFNADLISDDTTPALTRLCFNPACLIARLLGSSSFFFFFCFSIFYP